MEYTKMLEKRDSEIAVKRVKGNIRDYMVCPLCGSYVIEDAKFCFNCGQRLNTKDWML